MSRLYRRGAAARRAYGLTGGQGRDAHMQLQDWEEAVDGGAPHCGLSQQALAGGQPRLGTAIARALAAHVESRLN